MAIGALVLVLAACSSSDDSTASSAEANGADMAASDERAADSGGFSGEDAEAPAPESADGGAGLPFGDGLDLTDETRSVITQGQVTLSTEDPVATADDITQMVESMDGWVEGMTMQAGSDTVDPSAHVVTRIPSGDVGTALGRLRDLGELESVQIDRTDVTLEVHDLDARIRAVEMSVDRMEALLARADTTEDLVMAEQMLTDRQSQLEQLLSQQATLADQVSMSTLTIDVVVPEDVPEVVEPEEPKEGFLGGLQTGWEAFLDFGAGALLVLGTLLPWLVFVAALAVLAVWLHRAWVKVRPERAPRAPRQVAPPVAAMWQGAPQGAPGAPGWVQPGGGRPTVPAPAPAPVAQTSAPPAPPEPPATEAEAEPTA